MGWLRAPEFWKYKGLRSTSLLPLSYLYRFVASLKQRRGKAFNANIPVICVGNVTVGGAGKTPTVLWLLKYFQDQGVNAHVLLRGYGGATKINKRVTDRDTVETVGDEALIYQSIAPTWVGGDRVTSACLAQEAGAQVLIMDDGFQNFGLAKDLNILVIDTAVGVGNGRCLPAGPLREPLSTAFARTDLVLAMGRKPLEIGIPDDLPILKGQIHISAEDQTWLKERRVLAFSGIGRPQKFFDSLTDAGADLVTAKAFGDHHVFSTLELTALETLARDADAVLVTTTKDFQRLDSSWQTKVRAVHADLKILEHEILNETLTRLLP